MRLLRDCARPVFAASAWYRVPRGAKHAEGFTIRFAEAAARHIGNLDISNMVIYDDTEKRIVKILVTDLESNLTFTADVVVRKVLERHQVNETQVILGERFNSRGQRTFLVAAGDDDLADKFGALASKAIRNLVLRVLPGDIRDEAKLKIAAVRHSEVAKDPDAAKKSVIDGFAQINILPATLAEYVDHSLDQLVPAEIDDLRNVYAAVSQGEFTWADVMREKAKERGEDSEGEAKQSEAGKRLRERAVKAAKAGKTATPGDGVPETE